MFPLYRRIPLLEMLKLNGPPPILILSLLRIAVTQQVFLILVKAMLKYIVILIGEDYGIRHVKAK